MAVYKWFLSTPSEVWVWASNLFSGLVQIFCVPYFKMQWYHPVTCMCIVFKMICDEQAMNGFCPPPVNSGCGPVICFLNFFCSLITVGEKDVIDHSSSELPITNGGEGGARVCLSRGCAGNTSSSSGRCQQPLNGLQLPHLVCKTSMRHTAK